MSSSFKLWIFTCLLVVHEWALAEAVISAISKLAEREKFRRLDEVVLGVGELQQIDLQIFKLALDQLKVPKFEGLRFRIRVEAAELKCRACGKSWSFDREMLEEDVREMIHFIPEISHAYLKCPRCGSPDFEILKGRGVWIREIKGEKLG